MATLAATTLENVKTLVSVKAGNTSLDDILNDLIASVSVRAENYIGRSFEQVPTTEVFDIGKSTGAVFLRNWPIKNGETFEVRNHSMGDFTVDAMSADLYSVREETGRLKFRSYLITGADTLQVQYTGGLAADLAALQAISDLEFAIRRQVAHEFTRRLSPATKQGVRGSKTKDGQPGEGQVEWLEITKSVLDSYRGAWVGGGVGAL